MKKSVTIVVIGGHDQRNTHHIVPLSAQAAELLKDIHPITGHRDFVFPNQRSPKTSICTKSINKAIRACGFDTKTQHCAHGFRAAARTMLAEQLHLRIDWIEQQLAHKVSDQGADGRCARSKRSRRKSSSD